MKIALVDLSLMYSCFEDGCKCNANSSLTLSTINQIIARCDSHEVCFVPTNNHNPSSLTDLIDTCSKQMADLKPLVIFISACSAYAGRALNLSKKWKQEIGSKVVLGGRHFEEPRLSHYSPQELTLDSQVRQPITTSLLWGQQNKCLDYVYSGSGGNIPHLLKAIEDGLTADAEGIFTLSGRYLQGKGRCREFPAGIIPISKAKFEDGDDYLLRVIVSDYCPEGCGFCVGPSRLGVSFDEALLSQAATAIIANTCDKTTIIQFCDSNPIRPDSIDKYGQIIKQVRKAKPYRQYGMFMNTAYLIDRRFFDYTMQFVRTMDIMSLFVGRDCLTGEIAGAIGRNHNRLSRSQEMLDGEQNVICKILSASDQYQKFNDFIHTCTSSDNKRIYSKDG